MGLVSHNINLHSDTGEEKSGIRVFCGEESRKCETCGSSFRDEKHLTTHMKQEHHCAYCGKIEAKNCRGLRKHQRRCEMNPKRVPFLPSIEFRLDEIQGKQDSHECLYNGDGRDMADMDCHLCDQELPMKEEAGIE